MDQGVPGAFGFGQRKQKGPPRTPEEASGQQDLILVGDFNGWSVRPPRQLVLGQRLLPDQSWQHETRLLLNSSGELEFQVLSKAAVWEWCLYPEDADRALLRSGEPGAVKVGLSVLDGAHDKNFRIAEAPRSVVALKVRVSGREFQVWYDREEWGLEDMAAQAPTVRTWTVLGGADRGGIAVREGAAFDSATLLRRLSTGALVREEERYGSERLCYERLWGTGPLRGWVSIHIPGKELLQEGQACANPYHVREAPEARKKKPKEEPVAAPAPAPDDSVDWTGGHSVLLKGLESSRAAEAPQEAAWWSRLEQELFERTNGDYTPTVVSKVRREAPKRSGAQRLRDGKYCRVSVVTPTTESRSAYHERLWACFKAQQWPDKELVVVDTAKQPSNFFLKLAESHEELVYLCARKNYSIGLKRNMAIHLASGDVVVNFDDDDIYAPNYVEVMVGQLEEQRLAALTLSAWHDYHVRSGRCGFVDPASMHDLDLLMQKAEEDGKDIKDKKEVKIFRDEAVEQAVFGYGFSYVHRRGPALSNPYPDSWFGEDLVFMRQLRWNLGKHSVGLHRDEQGICLHMMHGANTADSVAHRSVAPKEFKALQVFNLNFEFAMAPRGAPSPANGPSGKFFSVDWKARRQARPEESAAA